LFSHFANWLSSVILLTSAAVANADIADPCDANALEQSLGDVADLYDLAGASPIFEDIQNVQFLIVDQPTWSRMPTAGVYADGEQFIRIPKALPSFVCRYVLATHLSIESNDETDLDEITDLIWMPAQNALNLCANDSSKSNNECLVLHSDLLGGAISSYLGMITEQRHSDISKTAYSQTRDALAGLILHEIGHHARNHFSRISTGEISRKSAEFEADLYAAETLLANGIDLSGYSNFFIGLAQTEIASDLGPVAFYETPFCRFAFSRYIDGNKGIVGGFLINWSLFGSASHTRTKFNDLFAMMLRERESYQDPWTERECELPENTQMIAVSEEMQALLEFLYKNRAILFSHSTASESAPAMPVGSRAAIIELTDSIERGVHLRAFKSRLAMIFLRRHIRSGQIDRFRSSELEEVLSVISSYGVAEDVRVANIFLSEL